MQQRSRHCSRSSVGKRAAHAAVLVLTRIDKCCRYAETIRGRSIYIREKAPEAFTRSRGASAARAQRTAPSASKLGAAKHAGLVVAAAGHERPVLHRAGGREEGRHVELRKHLPALPAKEALRGAPVLSCRIWGASRSCIALGDALVSSRADARGTHMWLSLLKHLRSSSIIAELQVTSSALRDQFARKRTGHRAVSHGSTCASAGQLWSRWKLPRVSSWPRRMLTCLRQAAVCDIYDPASVDAVELECSSAAACMAGHGCRGVTRCGSRCWPRLVG